MPPQCGFFSSLAESGPHMGDLHSQWLKSDLPRTKAEVSRPWLPSACRRKAAVVEGWQDPAQTRSSLKPLGTRGGIQSYLCQASWEVGVKR